MLFSDRPRTHYEKAPLHEVICQLRFPTILSINSKEPADFQELIRKDYPKYARRQEMSPAMKNNPEATPINNYHFFSEDGLWKLNLTQNFIALSTLRYSNWEEFSRYLDTALAAFTRTYEPAHFLRVGLRYLNIVSRKNLGVEETAWADLITPTYLGVLTNEDVQEDNIIQNNCNLQLKLDSTCQAHIRSGLGLLKNNTPGAAQDSEKKLILDFDLSMGGTTSPALAAPALETLHGHATRLFEGAVTDRLRDAMKNK